MIQITSAGLIKSNLVFLFIINKNVNFECISIAKHIINLFNDKLIIEYIRKGQRKCIQGTNFPPSDPPGEIMPFGMSPVNYSDSDSVSLFENLILPSCQ